MALRSQITTNLQPRSCLRWTCLPRWWPRSHDNRTIWLFHRCLTQVLNSCTHHNKVYSVQSCHSKQATLVVQQHYQEKSSWTRSLNTFAMVDRDTSWQSLEQVSNQKKLWHDNCGWWYPCSDSGRSLLVPWSYSTAPTLVFEGRCCSSGRWLLRFQRWSQLFHRCYSHDRIDAARTHIRYPGIPRNCNYKIRRSRIRNARQQLGASVGPQCCGSWCPSQWTRHQSQLRKGMHWIRDDIIIIFIE